MHSLFLLDSLLYMVVKRLDRTFNAGIFSFFTYSYLVNPMLLATSLKHCLQSIKLYVRISPLYEPHRLHHLPPFPWESFFLPVNSYSLGFGICLFDLYSIFLFKELYCLFFIYPVCLAYLSVPSALRRDPISGSV